METACLFFFIFTFGVIQIEGVRITLLHVPLGASHEAPLDCKYDLENDILYDVKWYKDGKQFFRCQPNGDVQEYFVEGVKVEHLGYANVGSCPLTLKNLDSKSAGEYKCEVSTEGPAFKLAVQSAKMRIIQSSRRIQGGNATNVYRRDENFVYSKNEQSARNAAITEFRIRSIFIICVIFVVNIYL